MARSQAVLSDLSFKGKLRLLGADRVEFLQGMQTNDIERLKPGMGCYSVFTSGKAKILSDCHIYCLPDSFLLGFEPGVTDKIIQHLDKYIIASDVTIENLTERWGILSVFGPKAPDLLSKVLGGLALPSSLDDLIEAPFGSHSMVVARNEITGEVGFDLWIAKEGLAGIFQALNKAGAGLCGQTALNLLRVEAGIPRYGVDMDESHFPMEAGLLARAINETKGCYIGQETIARALAQGQMNRHLLGLTLTGVTVPEPGQSILVNDRKVGYITSAVQSNTLGKVIALGYLHRDFTQPGTEVRIDSKSESLPATVTELPFYRRPA